MGSSTNGPGSGIDSDGRGIVRARYDWSETPPSEAAVRAIAIAADCGPLELAPLYDSVDPDALDECVRSLAGSDDAPSSAVTFSHDGRTVAVHASGQVLAWPVERRDRPPLGG